MKRTRFRAFSFAATVVACAAAPVAAQPTNPTPDIRPETVGRAGAELPPPTETDIGAALHSISTPGGMTADQAAARAIETAPSMRRADVAIMAAEAGSAQAFIALFPDFNFGARYTHTSRVVNQFSTSSASADQLQTAIELSQSIADGDPAHNTTSLLLTQIFMGFQQQQNLRFPFYQNQYALTAQMTWPVSAVFLSLLPMYRAAGHAEEAARLQSSVERQTIGLRAREAYYEHARALGALTVAEQAVATVQAHRDQVAALVEAGVAPRSDLLRLEAQVAAANVSVANARMGVEITQRALAVLLADEEEALPHVTVGEDFTAEIEAPGDLPQLESMAFERRTELESLREAYLAQEARVRGIAGSRYPTLSVVGNAEYSNPNQRYFPQQRRFRSYWDVSAVLSWSPRTTATAQQQMRAAQAELERIDTQHAELLDALRVEVAQSYHALVAARAAYEAAVIEVRAADENYRVRFEQLQQGAAVTSDLLDAQTDLTRARLQLVDAAIQMRVARARLGRSIGEGAEAE